MKVGICTLNCTIPVTSDDSTALLKRFWLQSAVFRFHEGSHFATCFWCEQECQIANGLCFAVGVRNAWMPIEIQCHLVIWSSLIEMSLNCLNKDTEEGFEMLQPESWKDETWRSGTASQKLDFSSWYHLCLHSPRLWAAMVRPFRRPITLFKGWPIYSARFLKRPCNLSKTSSFGRKNTSVRWPWSMIKGKSRERQLLR